MAGSFTENDGTPDPSTGSGSPRATSKSEGAPYAYRRTVEIATAVAVALTGVVVVAESLTHDIGWNETGPGSGYFPFRVGLLLVGASLLQAWQGARGAGSASSRSPASGPAGRPVGTISFVSRAELRRSLSVFWPTVALVVAMFPLGCYVPSGVYLAWMMRRHGGHGWLLSVAYGAAVMVAFFLVFDLWFRVPLAKGPLEALFSIY